MTNGRFFDRSSQHRDAVPTAVAALARGARSLERYSVDLADRRAVKRPPCEPPALPNVPFQEAMERGGVLKIQNFETGLDIHQANIPPGRFEAPAPGWLKAHRAHHAVRAAHGRYRRGVIR
jgi:hypothetical protein